MERSSRWRADRRGALASRISAALENTRPPECTAFQSDMRIRVLATGRSTYPDVSIVCGPIEVDPADRSGTTITNPTLLVEVLSPSTEEVHRGSKWRDYQLIPSLQEFVLVSQESRIEIYRRLTAESWEYLDVREGIVKLASGATSDLSTLYLNLPLQRTVATRGARVSSTAAACVTRQRVLLRPPF